MSISHVPRERNIWADDLANLNIAGFDPAKRWDPIAELGNTIVLKDLLLRATAGAPSVEEGTGAARHEGQAGSGIIVEAISWTA